MRSQNKQGRLLKANMLVDFVVFKKHVTPTGRANGVLGSRSKSLHIYLSPNNNRKPDEYQESS